jgi:hypothetical protein
MKTPDDILKIWMAAVNKGDVETLISLYDKNAVLIPTFSNIILNTTEKIRDYFERLKTRERLSISLHEKTFHVQKIYDNIFELYGIYCWRFVVDEELLNFEARFSYTVNLDLPNPILHHHSSQIPRLL